MKLDKLNDLLLHSFVGIWIAALGIIIYTGKKIADVVWQALFEKGARAVGSVVGDKVKQELKKELKPVKERVQRIEHALKNADSGKAGTFDLILEQLQELKNKK